MGRGANLLLDRPQPRLAKDYENLADTLAAFVAIASIRLALKRLARLA